MIQSTFCFFIFSVRIQWMSDYMARSLRVDDDVKRGAEQTFDDINSFVYRSCGSVLEILSCRGYYDD